MRQISVDKRSKLMNHLLTESYIDREDKFDSFLNAISDSFFNQLLEDMTYDKSDEVEKVDANYGWGTDKYL